MKVKTAVMVVSKSLIYRAICRPAKLKVISGICVHAGSVHALAAAFSSGLFGQP
jgi:hypothetical protein